MANNLTYSQIYSLSDVTFPAGTTYKLKFTVKDQSGSGINITSASCSWRMSEYGSDYAILTKVGNVVATDSFDIILNNADTIGLSGKFTHQPYVYFASGVGVIPAQGVIVITKGIV